MRTAKHSLVTAVALVAVGFAITLLLPTAAHGVVATLVQVVNTAANPVPIQNMDDGARSPFQISKEFLLASAIPCAPVTVYSVPSTPLRRLVIETVSLNADTSGPENGATLDITTTAGGNKVTHHFGTIPVPFNFFSIRGVHWVIGNPSIRLYADPGTDVSAQECVQNTPINVPAVSISGYFVNLP